MFLQQGPELFWPARPCLAGLPEPIQTGHEGGRALKVQVILPSLVSRRIVLGATGWKGNPGEEPGSHSGANAPAGPLVQRL